MVVSQFLLASLCKNWSDMELLRWRWGFLSCFFFFLSGQCNLRGEESSSEDGTGQDRRGQDRRRQNSDTAMSPRSVSPHTLKY